MPASRALPLAIIGGLAAGLLFGAILTESFGGEILCWMSPLPLFAVGFRLGSRAVGIAALAGTVAVAAGDPALGLGFVVFVALPVVALAWLALTIRDGRVSGALVLGLTGIGLLGFLLAVLLASGADGGLQGVVTDKIKEAAETAVAEIPGMPELPPQALEMLSFLLTGSAIGVWMMLIAGNGILAQALLSRFGGMIAARPEMAGIELPRLVSVAFLASLAAALAGSGEIAFLGTNIAEILLVPLLFGGLAVIHALLAHHPARQFWLTLFYAVVLGFGLTIGVVVILGVVEEWAGLRRRFAVSAPPRR
jgi:Predicted membrane protein (DUF2232)